MTGAGSSPCRVCGTEISASSARCSHCNAAHGSLEACPHCSAEAGSSPSTEFRHVCDVCGGPQIPRLDKTIKFSGAEVPLLRKANQARKGRAFWRATAILCGLALGFTVTATGLLFLIFGASFALGVGAAPFAVLFAVLLGLSLTRITARTREIPAALDAAWLSAATDIAEATPARLSAHTLSHCLGIDEPQAEELLALVDVNTALGAGQRLRIGSEIQAQSPRLAEAQTEASLAESELEETHALQARTVRSDKTS